MILFRITSFLLLTFLFISCAKKEPQNPETVYNDFQNSDSLQNRITLFEEFKETNPNDRRYLEAMLYGIIGDYSNEKKFTEAANYLQDNSDVASTNLYNAVAWNMFETKKNIELAKEIANSGIEFARKEIENPSIEKPEDVSEEDWQNSKKQSLGFILDTYANIEKELGNNTEAESAFEEAIELTKNEFIELNDNYIKFLLENDNYEKAKLNLEKFITSGTASETMKSDLKEVFVQLNGNEDNFSEYLASLEELAKEKMVENLKNKIINEPAPEFELLDLDGKKVKLSDFKGKTIILDFWATWCGPCLKSFPSMQKAMESFKSNNKVKFLYANTWERVDDKLENAKNFIKTNNYPFHVLMDDQNEVVAKFNVKGIPTKFIIDKNQNIRFESVGFSGTEDELIEELHAMVKMIE